jgi:hypothetical protein
MAHAILCGIGKTICGPMPCLHSLKTGPAHGDVLALLEFRSLEDEYRPNVRPGSPAHGDVLALLEFRSLEDEYRPNVRQGTNDWDVPV